MTKFIHILIVSGLLFAFQPNVLATDKPSSTTEAEDLNVKDFIIEHISDSYEWHFFTWGEKHISVSLPIIVYSKRTKWHIFSSSQFQKHPVYYGLTIAKDGKYKGKIVEINSEGRHDRPFDISLTKIVISLWFNSILLILIILGIGRSYKKTGIAPKQGFVGFMELFIMNISNELIKPCIGIDYKRFVPFLLTVFFYILLSNLMGLVPFFPGGANVTGNIAITFVLAIFIFILVNATGTREYWREIFWPDVPVWLKFPIPLMPIVEIMGIFTKPFALMIRLFANILAGHAITLGLMSVIFVTVKMGVAMNTSMTALSVFFSVFIGLVEVLVAYIQAYVFTMLAAVFIGLARVRPYHEDAQKHLD
jgi:F-type H+-transporting ATPase subunit a